MSFFIPPNPQQPIAVAIPSALSALYNFENSQFALIDPSSGPAAATCTKTPEQIFANYSTALSSPAATLYVNVATGSDSNNGSSGSPLQTLGQAIHNANAGGVATKIIIAAGFYNWFQGPSYYIPTNSTNLAPTVDIAFVATGGRVVCSTAIPETFSADGTYTNTYSFSQANVDRVYDLLNLDRFGCYQQLTYVASPTQCNNSCGTWTVVSNKVYVHRADGGAVTANNTRFTLHGSDVFLNPNNVNMYLGDGMSGATGSGFDIEGGSDAGWFASSSSTNVRVQVGVGCTFRYAGGINGTASADGYGFASISKCGHNWLFNCDASGNANDGFDIQNYGGASISGLWTVNCTANNNGTCCPVATSVNGWTHHQGCIGADFAGSYENNRGGTVRSVNNAIGFFAGTYVKNDLGDIAHGGTVTPTAFRVDDTAVYYCFRTKAEMPGGQFAYNAAATTAEILQNQCWPTRGLTGGAGTVGTY